jgi:hypothetical protein
VLAGVEFWVFVLFAEYAATIRTLPPKEISKRRAAEASTRRQPSTFGEFLYGCG